MSLATEMALRDLMPDSSRAERVRTGSRAPLEAKELVAIASSIVISIVILD